MLICFSVSALSCPQAKATEINLAPSDFDAVKALLQGCDESLATHQRLLKLRDQEVAAQDAIIQKQLEQVEKSHNDTLGSNPLLYFIAGMLVTGLTVKLVR